MSGVHERADVAEFLVFAQALADASATVILPFFRSAIRVDDKGGDGAFDPVTEADRESERVIDGMLRERWPNHGLIGEEFGLRNPEARFQWVVDPIDGTRSFVMGSPLWGSLIGVLDSGTPILGLMNQPFTRERFWGSAAGSFMRRDGSPPTRISTRPRALKDAVLTTTHPDLFTEKDAAGFAALKGAVQMTRYGGDCYAYCLLAAGFVDLVAETGLKPYDIAPLIPIVENAGGLVTTWDGGPAAGGGRILAAGGPDLHAAALDLLSSRS